MDTDLDGDRFTCATHNYSFVMMPQAYEILHKYKETLERRKSAIFPISGLQAILLLRKSR